jgi:DNA helicase-2/ATP-dependent DNA helicase PcrA
MRLIRVNGPPGTGKTTYLSQRVTEAADKFGAGAVVVASLTRAAASEVAGRKTPLPARNIGTLHSHAYQALKRPVVAETADGLRAWNEWVGIQSMRIDPKHAVDPENATAEQGTFDTEGAALLNECNILRQQMIDVSWWTPRVQRFWVKWCEWKAESRYVDFTDLIEAAIDKDEPMPQNPAVLMLDEAQDFSRLEFKLAMQWGQHCQWMMVVGDADQNLYEWRGTDPDAFTSIEAVEVRTLEQSYRVPRAVHAAAVRWIEQIPDREPVAYKPRGADGHVQRMHFNWRDPVALVHDITKTTDSEHVPVNEWPQVMVLAACNYMLTPLLEELRGHGIPFWNPYRVKQGNWNPLRGAGRLTAFVKPQAPPKGEAAMWTWRDLRRWMDPMQSKGVLVRGVKSNLEAKCFVDRFKDTRADDAVQLDEVMAMFTSDEHRSAAFEGDIDWWESVLKHDDRRRQQYALTVARRRGFGALRETPRLCVGTIHSVKGGQADVVYLFPDISTVASEAWRRHVRAPIIRQFYVAMTRAREELVLCSPSGATAVRWQ